MSDDGFFAFMMGCIIFVFVFSVVGLVAQTNRQNSIEQSRYELCLKKKNMQWVDGNCLNK